METLKQEANKRKEGYQNDEIYHHEADYFTFLAVVVLFEVVAAEFLVNLLVVVVFFEADLTVHSHFCLC